jgi:hypothetical protein
MDWFDYIAQHPDKNWNYYYLSKNPNITWEHVQYNPDKNCDSTITWDIVTNY